MSSTINLYLCLRQLTALKERQEQVRHDALSETDEALADLRRRHDHEKLILQDENQKLITDIDRVSAATETRCGRRACRQSDT